MKNLATRSFILKASVLVLGSLALAAGATVASAFWTSPSQGTASATVATWHAPNNVTASAVNATVTVSWNAGDIDGNASAVTRYDVRRNDSSNVVCSTTTGLSCSNTSVPSDTYTYKVTAVFATFSAESSSSASVIVVNDNTPPTVSSINLAGSSPTNASSVNWTVTFSENVVNVGSGNFSLANTGLTSPSVSGVTPVSGSVYTVTASTGTGSGSLGLNLSSIGAIADGAGNALAGTFTGQVYSIDKTAPVTTDNTGAIGNGWTRSTVVLALSPTDAGSGVAHTYYSTDGSTPSAGSSEGTAITLSSDGIYTIKYFSVDTVGNTEAIETAGTQIRIDKTAPVTTDNTASIGSGVKTSPVTVTLSPSDSGSGIAQTYYTINGSIPTTSSSQGTSIVLSVDGTYTIKYFSVDNAGNTESVKTAGTQININLDPMVVDVSSTRTNGNYKAGTVIPVTVTFSESVTVVGAPRLSLATGSPASTAVNYTSGSGSTTLTFNYTVANGNTSADLDYVSSNALSLNGGTIKNGTAAAVLTLANPGAADSLSANKDLVLDTTAPTVSAVSTTNGRLNCRRGRGRRPITFTFSEEMDPATLFTGCSRHDSGCHDWR